MTFPDSTENEKEPSVKKKHLPDISLKLLMLYFLNRKNTVIQLVYWAF